MYPFGVKLLATTNIIIIIIYMIYYRGFSFICTVANMCVAY